MKEVLLVIRKKYINPYFTGLYNGSIINYVQDFSKNLTYLDRDKAEEDFDFKQLTIQILIRDSANRYFCMQRTKKQTEARLHDKFSLTVGGHINTGDIDTDSSFLRTKFLNTVFNSLERELTEETNIKIDYKKLKPDFVGFINDDSDDVSKVHLGILFVIECDDCTVKETNKMTGKYMTINEISNIYDKLEGWSKIIYDEYISRG